MWSAFFNGAWHPVGPDEALVQLAQSGQLRRDSLVHHSSFANAGLAGDVRFLDAIFGPAPVVHEMARSARNWGLGSLLCGAAAPIALFMGLRAWAEIRKAPSRYSNVSDAILAVALGGVQILLVLLGLAAFIVGAAAAEKATKSGQVPSVVHSSTR
jgi:hypothetical protein